MLTWSDRELPVNLHSGTCSHLILSSHAFIACWGQKTGHNTWNVHSPPHPHTHTHTQNASTAVAVETLMCRQTAQTQSRNRTRRSTRSVHRSQFARC